MLSTEDSKIELTLKVMQTQTEPKIAHSSHQNQIMITATDTKRRNKAPPKVPMYILTDMTVNI